MSAWPSNLEKCSTLTPSWKSRLAKEWRKLCGVKCPSPTSPAALTQRWNASRTRRRAIREGWFDPDQCELCHRPTVVVGEGHCMMFQDEPVEEPWDVFACSACIANPSRAVSAPLRCYRYGARVSITLVGSVRRARCGRCRRTFYLSWRAYN